MILEVEDGLLKDLNCLFSKTKDLLEGVALKDLLSFAGGLNTSSLHCAFRYKPNHILSVQQKMQSMDGINRYLQTCL